VVNGTEQVTNPVAYTANALNQYTVANGVSLPTTPAPAPHDLDGNLRFDGGVNKDNEAREYLWDAENRLTAVKRVSDSATVVSFLYDAQSRRIAKMAGTTATLYIYDSFNCIAEYSWSADLQSASLSKTRTWGIDLSGTLQGAGGVGGLLAETQGTSTFYPTFDGNGNVSEYFAADGSVAAHFEYDPFGNTVVNTDSSGQFSYRFSTKPLDSETGLYYYQYRYYDPQTGRWPSRDPIEEEGGINLYGYVGNDGVNMLDILGLQEIDGCQILEDCEKGCAGAPFFDKCVLDCYTAVSSGEIPSGLEWLSGPSKPAVPESPKNVWVVVGEGIVGLLEWIFD
jgi:RHS repeat-associated protein